MLIRWETRDTYCVASLFMMLSVMIVVSTKMTDTIPTNMWKSSDDKKVRYKIDCYNLHKLLLVIMLRLITAII